MCEKRSDCGCTGSKRRRDCMGSGHSNSKLSLTEVKKTVGETGLVGGDQHFVLDMVN